MKVFTRTVMNWDGSILEQDSEEYSGPVALCGGGLTARGGLCGRRGRSRSSATLTPTAATTQAVEDQQNKVKQSMGQQGTILTSPLGAQPVQQQGKSLLGQ